MSNVLKIVHFEGRDGRVREELWFKGGMVFESHDLTDCPEDARLSRDMVSMYQMATVAITMADLGLDKHTTVEQICFRDAFEDCDLCEFDLARYKKFIEE